MKVFIINGVCGKGSTGRIVVDLYNELTRRGHDAIVAHSSQPALGMDSTHCYTIGSTLDYYTHNVLSRLTDREGRYSRHYTKKLIEKIDEYNPDIVHLHNIHGHFVNYELLFEYLSKTNKNVMWTLHDCWAFTGHCAYFSSCMQWKGICTKCELLKSYPQCWFGGDVNRNFKCKKTAFTSIKNMKIIVPSKWLADLVKQSFLQKYPVEVIYNGINQNIFKPTESDFKKQHGISGKKIILGVAFAWNKKKGLSDFFRLAEIMPDEYVIVLIGLSKKFIEELPYNIIGIEKTYSAKQIAEIYSAAYVFVNPTYNDNFPTTNIEALCCQTPVITYATGGSIEAIDEKSGFIAPPGDVNGLLEAIKKVDRLNPDDVLRRGKLFDAKSMYAKYIDEYTDMLKNRK